MRPISCGETLFAPHCGYLCHLACMQHVVRGDTGGDETLNPRLRAVRCPICKSRHPMAACIDRPVETSPGAKVYPKPPAQELAVRRERIPGVNSCVFAVRAPSEPASFAEPSVRGLRAGGIPEDRALENGSLDVGPHATFLRPPKLNQPRIRSLKSAPPNMLPNGGVASRPSRPPASPHQPTKGPPSPRVLRRTQSLGNASEFFEALDMSRLRGVNKGDRARSMVAPIDPRKGTLYAGSTELLDAPADGRCKCGCTLATQKRGDRMRVVAQQAPGRSMDAIYWTHVARRESEPPERLRRTPAALERTKSM